MRLHGEMERWHVNQASLAARLGISPGTVSGWFSKGALPQPRIRAELAKIFDVTPEWLIYGTDPKLSSQAMRRGEQAVPNLLPLRTTENAAMYKTQPRMIPLLSWAQAGIATAFEEIPEHWQEFIPAVVTDKQAFAIQLRGDSMEPKYSDGDIAVVLPSTPARAGDLVIAKIKEEGFSFKIMNLVGGGPEQIKLTSYNPLYEPRILPREAFHWIYPVHSVNKLIRR